MKIVVVGGGTAGWIFTYFLCNTYPDCDITVIESSQIGIIGAGEGSTGTLIDLLTGKYFPKKIDLEQFKQKTDGTNKHGIYHDNWNGDGRGYFAPLDGTPSRNDWEDFVFKYTLATHGKNKFHLSSPAGVQFEYNIFDPIHAFHFDGHKVGNFFKEICVEENSVRVIDDIVNEVEETNEHIEYIQLKNGGKIEADLYVDCTGFARVLSKKIGVKWKSCSEFLPVNTAIPFIEQWETDEQFKPCTKATALSSGWMWEIPLQTRKGCGYVFDDRFITPKNAIKEVEEYLGKPIDPIKTIKFDSGYAGKFWKNNCISFGLSSGFFEPLEATSIHSTIVQCAYFFKNHFTTDKNSFFQKANQDFYNRQISCYYETILDFISFHYITKRNDSNFWNYITESKISTQFAKQLKKKAEVIVPSVFDVTGYYGSPNVSLYNWIAAGLEIITPDQAQDEISRSLSKVTAETLFNEQFINETVNNKKTVYY